MPRITNFDDSELTRTLLDAYADTGAENVSLSALCDQVVDTYLELVDPTDPPTSAQVLNQLKASLVSCISWLNANTTIPEARLSMPNSLDIRHIAKIMVRLHGVVRFVPSGYDDTIDLDLGKITMPLVEQHAYTSDPRLIQAVAMQYRTRSFDSDERRDLMDALLVIAPVYEQDAADSPNPVYTFWHEFRNVFVWDLLPFNFLYQLYRSWMDRTKPQAWHISNTQFTKDLAFVIDHDASDKWLCEKHKQFRPGHKMDKPEPLIDQYGLENWRNPNYDKNEVDPSKRCTPDVTGKVFRGVLRNPSTPAHH